MKRSVLTTGALILVGAASLLAADVRTLATLAVEGALVDLARDYQRISGHNVSLAFDTGPNLARRISEGETPDVIIAPAAAVEQAVRDGRAVAATSVPVGRVAVGVAVRRGAHVPDISSVDAFKQALVAADAVVYSHGTSGVYMEKLFADLGIADAIRSKVVRLATGVDAMERVATGRGNDLGFTMVSEVFLFEAKGVRLAGPLPAAIQNYTTYNAAVMTASPNQEASAGFVRYITTPAARRVFAATGWE